jgi:hypothetical protein
MNGIQIGCECVREFAKATGLDPNAKLFFEMPQGLRGDIIGDQSEYS